MTRQTFPELKDQCDQLLKIDWQDLYDPRAKLLFGGFNTEKNEVGSWHYDFLGADSRLVSFLAIAMSGVPLQSWSALNRNLEERYGIQYLKPGWQGGGLFMGFMSGLFLDEEGSLPGLAAGNFAKAQMVHQEKIGSPVWGWSASDSPANGYLGFNAIRDEIITPHASTLAISVFPKEVIQNLKKLEELGVRPRHIIEGQYYDFGFRDAIDLKTARVTKNYLILDQTMLFLALTNFLENKFIIRAFNSYDGVMEGYKKIKDYFSTHFTFLNLYFVAINIKSMSHHIPIPPKVISLSMPSQTLPIMNLSTPNQPKMTDIINVSTQLIFLAIVSTSIYHRTHHY